MAIEELELIKRSVDGIQYHVDNVPVADRDLRVLAEVTCEKDGWVYDGQPSPKRVDLCIARHLTTQATCTPAQLRWCASVGLSLGLNAPNLLGFLGSSSLDAALASDTRLAHERLALIVHELVMGKNGDRMVNQMALRFEASENGALVFQWIPPPKAGIFAGVKDALNEVAVRARKLTPFNFGDK